MQSPTRQCTVSIESGGPTSQHLQVSVPCGSAIFKGGGATGVHYIHIFEEKKFIDFKESRHDSDQSSCD